MEDKKTFWTKKNKIIIAIVGLSALLIIFIIALAADDAEKSARIKELYAKSGCPQNYVLNSVSRMCVRLVSEGKTWSEAKQYCESQGDTLAQFKTSESVEWLRNYIKNDAPEKWRNECNWIGLSYTYFNGWSWVDGTPLDSYLWDRSDGQPDNSDGTSCGCECNFNSGQDQGLHDCRCSLSGAYSICERPLECPLSVGN